MGLRSSVEELIERAGGCLVIDGGLATQLEALGADIHDPIWSARCLISDPNLIKQVHMQYLEASADVLITSSYQASIPGFLAKGFSIKENGSEYSGLYGDVNLEKLKDFHRRRVQVLVDADPDILAFETIPNKLELRP
ncbi:hypothetical protein J5N97_007002 [Dioscorea zingiberensis]|uniref:Hcy-binding domain-containing protein n=1 Tax=Dioscorea zingiberensis TaxID=325984 RepID=A0A9D5DB65_9LILI|nr:hypothetical protein J5N97_007002 [Dioscorea zingiberensis]